MNLSDLSRSAVLLSVLALVTEPLLADEEKTGSRASSQKRAPSEAKARRTPPGHAARSKAQNARQRAQEAKKSGKTLVAERLEKAASTWEKVARHQEEAAKLEEDAAQIEKKTLDLKAQARRAHSLVEQTETRRARAVARLRELGQSDLPSSPQSANPGAKDSEAVAPSKAESK